MTPREQAEEWGKRVDWRLASYHDKPHFVEPLVSEVLPLFERIAELQAEVGARNVALAAALSRAEKAEALVKLTEREAITFRERLHEAEARVVELEAKLREAEGISEQLRDHATCCVENEIAARSERAIADRLAAALETTLSSWPSDYSDEPIERCRAALAAYDAARVKEPPAPREVVASLGISEALYRAKSGKEE